VFDPVCGPLFELAFRSLSWRGRHLVVGFAGGPIPKLPANLPLMKGAGLIGVDVRQFFEYEGPLADAYLAEMLDWVGTGKLSPPVGPDFPLDDFGAAMEFAMAGRSLGKPTITLA
jgi:NADPH2:quinone reductase